MTVVQLAQRLATRYLDPGELNLLPGDAHLALCDAINAATTDYYSHAPSCFGRGTISFVLPAPAVLDAVQVTNNSATLGSNAFTSDQRGCSVLVAGDASLNVVGGPAMLLDAYLGATGTTQATVYGDAALFGAGVFSSLVGDPHVYRADDPHGHLLTRDDNLRVRHAYTNAYRIGRPLSYGIFPAALPGAGGDLFALRVHPMPDVACAVRVDANLQPLQFSPDDLTQPFNLPVPEHHCVTILLPLAAAALADFAGNYWREGVRPPDAAPAMERLQSLPTDFAVPRSMVGTPSGF